MPRNTAAKYIRPGWYHPLSFSKFTVSSVKSPGFIADETWR
ncbi:hypothetical protein HMPREF0294_1864 [Corynebacterium glucuronolyticum ATCC 51867]|nr:hypothetical protein HMPREF0294_1864 [Corynebacterium glucuronolyticum ATCC 51867]